MIKTLTRAAFIISLIAASQTALAQQATGGQQQQAQAGGIEELIKNFKNFSTYFAIDVETEYGPNTVLPLNTFDIATIKNFAKGFAFNTIFINPVLGIAFQNFSSPGSVISANPTIDQTMPGTGTFAPTPTMQMILNNFTTPRDPKNCYDANKCLARENVQLGYSGFAWLNQNPASATPDKLIDMNTLQQLTADSLVGPLKYNTEMPGGGTGSPTGQQSGAPLTAQNQAQLAQNFIRNVTYQSQPIPMPRIQTFRDMLIQIQDKAAEGAEKQGALETLVNFASELRSYAAQMSVGTSNLNWIMAQRMPNPATQNLSQAQIDYQNATHRLFDINKNKSTWYDEMEKATPLTVQRQMVYLLAEMNLQLYYLRQSQERMLMTMSAFQIQYANVLKTAITLESAGEEIPIEQYSIPKPTF